jgi:anti-anti-sigma factor
MQTTCVPTSERERVIQLRVSPDATASVAVVPVGDLDVVTGPALLAAVERAARRSRGATIAIDLGAVEFIDAAGFRSLLRCREVCARHRCGTAFIDPSPGVIRLAGLLDEARALLGER